MKLNDLLVDIVTSPHIDASSMSETFVTGLALNSSQVKAGNLFIALAGSQQHGLVYAKQAIELGAIAVIFDPVGGGDRKSVV